MKKHILLSTFSLILASQIGLAQTVINGKLKGIKDTTLFINYVDLNGYQTDKVAVRKGAFVWKKEINHPTNVIFSLSNARTQEKSTASIWTEPKTLQLELNANQLSSYRLKDSKTDVVANEMNQATKVESDQIKKFMIEFQEGKIAAADKEKKLADYRAIQKKITDKQLEFIEANPSNYYSAYLLHGNQMHISPDQLQKYLNMLQGDAAASPYAVRLRYDVKGEMEGSVGSKSPVFATTDMHGKNFNLQDLIGKKYIIIDFWASWCVPCRQANPHLKDLHNKYKEKGLEVICVADNDSSEPVWKKAIEDDKIQQFIHVLRGWKGMEYYFNRQDISGKYGVKSLPTKILIDLNGTIIGRYIGENPNSPEIDLKLKEVFGF